MFEEYLYLIVTCTHNIILYDIYTTIYCLSSCEIPLQNVSQRFIDVGVLCSCYRNNGLNIVLCATFTNATVDLNR